MIVLSVSTTNMLLITFILQSFYLSSQNALTVKVSIFTIDKWSLTVYNI